MADRQSGVRLRGRPKSTRRTGCSDVSNCRYTGAMLQPWRCYSLRLVAACRSHSFGHTFYHSFTHSLIPSFLPSFLPSHSFVHAFIHSSVHPFIHPFIHSSIHPFIHPFIRSSIHPFMCVEARTSRRSCVTRQNHYKTVSLTVVAAITLLLGR